jgi:tetratricopeptide (TPR) repeat protein
VTLDAGTALARRLDRYRAAARPDVRDRDALPPRDLAARLAEAVDGEIVHGAEGRYVRCERPARPLPIDREALATLPGQPPPEVPLVCLDTETTGLATAAGTAAFLIGLGWWESDAFRQVQLLLPDHGEEPAMLTALASAIPPRAWLVTYNGRGFDWPLLVTRFRMARRAPPPHDGHLDLLPIVRRLFRHRLGDARLRTAEAQLLGLHRVGDVEGWQIPGHYLAFLRGGPVEPLVDVVRHNDQDVRSLAWLLAHLEGRFADPRRRADASPGDLAGLARAFARERRLDEALECLDAAVDREIEPPDPPPSPVSRGVAESRRQPRAEDAPWWSPRRAADFGGRPRSTAALPVGIPVAPVDQPWTSERIAIDRAHVLRRLGRYAEALGAWQALTYGRGRTTVIAAIEAAKLLEHRLREPAAALAMAERGLALAERRRAIGFPEPALETNLVVRRDRLRRRLRRAATGGATPSAVP